MIINLKTKNLHKLQCLPNREHTDYYDKNNDGLMLRVRKTNHKSFHSKYMNHSKKIGEFPNISFKVAKIQHGVIRNQLIQNFAINTKIQNLTFGQGIIKFTNKHIKNTLRKNSIYSYENYFNRISQKLKNKKLTDITKQHIENEIETMVKKTIKNGNQAIATKHNLTTILKSLFKWFYMEELITTNPAEKIRNPKKPDERERFLNEYELKKLLSVVLNLPYPYKQFFMFLMITGQRKTEVMGINMDELDLQNKVWVLPANRSKSKRKNIIPLTPFLIDIIKSIPHNGNFLFSLDNGKSPIKYIQFTKDKIDNKVQFNDWTIHDLRRTAATWMVNLGVNEYHTKILLNHSSKKNELQITATYIQSEYFEQKLNAVLVYENFLKKLIN